jgi:hypothetical protein
MLSRLRDIPDHKDIDILFVGSSHSYRGFDPRIFNQHGISCFNLGSSAQAPITTEFLLNKYLDTLKPKIIVFEIYFLVFERDAIESSIDIISNSEIDAENLKISLSKPSLNTYNSIASVFVNRFIQPLEKIKEHQLPTEKYIRGGYVQKILKDSINKRMPRKFTPELITPKTDQVNALKRIIKLTKEKGIPIILVSAPITKEYLSSLQNYQDWHQTIHQLSNENKVTFIDYNHIDSIAFDTKIDFFDSNHLNQHGVEKFNKHFLDNFIEESFWQAKIFK